MFALDEHRTERLRIERLNRFDRGETVDIDFHGTGPDLVGVQSHVFKQAGGKQLQGLTW